MVGPEGCLRLCSALSSPGNPEARRSPGPGRLHELAHGIRTASATSTPIQCQRGVKQGCPLSPILFDLVIEFVIRAMEEVPRAGYQIAHSVVKTLTYADDLCAFASSTTTIQRMLTRAQDAANLAGLSFNPRKCAALTLVRVKGKRQRVDRLQPTIGGEPIPALP